MDDVMAMPRRPLTRGEAAVRWIEDWCQTPGGKLVRLSADQRATIYRTYDAGQSEVIAGPLAAFLSLLHLCGHEARSPRPPGLSTDLFSLWSAASPELRAHLRRHGDRVVCPGLGTAWPAAAA
jgi:hypothetical protein